MKKKFNLLYYIVFVAGLWLLNRHFRVFVQANGILLGLLVALVLAFLSRLVAKTITKVLLLVVVGGGLVVFLFWIGFFTLPDWVIRIWEMLPFVRGLLEG